LPRGKGSQEKRRKRGGVGRRGCLSNKKKKKKKRKEGVRKREIRKERKGGRWDGGKGKTLGKRAGGEIRDQEGRYKDHILQGNREGWGVKTLKIATFGKRLDKKKEGASDRKGHEAFHF